MFWIHFYFYWSLQLFLQMKHGEKILQDKHSMIYWNENALQFSGFRPGKMHQERWIMGKYKTCYDTSLGKMVKKIEIREHAKYACFFCGKTKMKRWGMGIWRCGSCMKTVAGGAWTCSTPSVGTLKPAIRRLRELKDQ